MVHSHLRDSPSNPRIAGGPVCAPTVLILTKTLSVEVVQCSKWVLLYAWGVDVTRIRINKMSLEKLARLGKKVPPKL